MPQRDLLSSGGKRRGELTDSSAREQTGSGIDNGTRTLLRTLNGPLAHRRLAGPVRDGDGHCHLVQPARTRPWVLLAGAAIVALMFFGWFSEVIRESERGVYNKAVDGSFRQGMIWFIFTEIMLFGAF